MQQNDTIKAMEAHAEDFNLELSTIGQLSVQSRHAYERIKRGTAHRDTERRVLGWLDADRKAREAQPADRGDAA